MNWSASVDIYCERLDASFWSEPINAVSNAAFIIAALWAAITAGRQGTKSAAVWLLITLAFCIGVGSFLFHTFATTWAGFADVIPIWIFVASYTLVAIALIGGAPPVKIAVGLAIVIAIATVLWLANDSPSNASTPTPNRFNGSEQYLPAVIAMLVITAVTLWRRHPIRYWFLAATVTFLVSLTFRTFDMAVCANWPYGTHFIWHMLNGATIALLLQALIRNPQRTPTP